MTRQSGITPERDKNKKKRRLLLVFAGRRRSKLSLYYIPTLGSQRIKAAAPETTKRLLTKSM
jgi:septum formation topological specificity factor MinE